MMGAFYFADIEDCGMIFAKSIYKRKKDCVNTAHAMGDTSITIDDVESRRAIVTYEKNKPVNVELTSKLIGSIKAWVIYS